MVLHIVTIHAYINPMDMDPFSTAFTTVVWNYVHMNKAFWAILLFQDDADSQVTSEKKDVTKKKKQLVKTVELPIESYTHGYCQTDLNNLMELEVSSE